MGELKTKKKEIRKIKKSKIDQKSVYKGRLITSEKGDDLEDASVTSSKSPSSDIPNQISNQSYKQPPQSSPKIQELLPQSLISLSPTLSTSKIMNMATDYRDPLLDLLGPSMDNLHASVDDIQMINRNGNINNNNINNNNINNNINNNSTNNSNHGFGSNHQLFQQHFPHMSPGSFGIDLNQSQNYNETQGQGYGQAKAQGQGNARGQNGVNAPQTPVLNHQQYYSTNFDFGSPNHISNFEKIQELEQSPPQQVKKPSVHVPSSTDGSLSADQDFDLQVFNKTNPSLFYKEMSLPPLPPLSESVLPRNYKPLDIAQVHQELSKPQQPQIQAHASNNHNKRRKQEAGPKTRPAFVMKIWSMVNDEANKEYIRWNDDGKTFQVFHREDFMKLILPNYFKHNNFASFVRQLNMYGWHKVQDINNGTMNQNCDRHGNGGQDEIWQFENPNFIRGREDLLDKIIRNKSTPGQDDVQDAPVTNASLSLILSELETIKMNQYAITEDLRRVRHDNKVLWQENYLNRERAQMQARTMDKVLKFLAAAYGNGNKLLDTQNHPLAHFPQSVRNSPMLRRAQTHTQSQGPQQPNDLNASLDSNIINNNSSNNNNNHNNINNKSSHQQQTHTEDHNSPVYQSPSSSEALYQQMQYKPRLLLTDQAHARRPSVSRTQSSPASIEEIFRSHNKARSNESNLKNMYQHLVNQDPATSPHPLFTDLTIPNNPAYDSMETQLKNSGQSIEQVQDWIEKLSQQQELAQKDGLHLDAKSNGSNNGVDPSVSAGAGTGTGAGAGTGADFASGANPANSDHNDILAHDPTLDHFNIDDYIQNGSPAPAPGFLNTSAVNGFSSPQPELAQLLNGYANPRPSSKKRTIHEIYDGTEEEEGGEETK